MQYLVMENRIINLAYRDVEINQPLPRSTDKRHRVTASDPERKISHALFQGTLDECQRFLEALGRALNFTLPAVPIETVLESMHPGADDEDDQSLTHNRRWVIPSRMRPSAPPSHEKKQANLRTEVI